MADDQSLKDFLKPITDGASVGAPGREERLRDAPWLIRQFPRLDYLGLVIPEVVPKDRAAEGELRAVTPVLPSPKSVKDVVGGVGGVLKGIVVDNALPIMGAKPLGSGDQPYTPLMIVEEAGFAVARGARPERFKLTTFDQWPPDVREDFVLKLQNDFRLRAGVASTKEGLALIKQLQIPLSPNEMQLADALKAKRERTALKNGSGNPVVAALTGSGNAVVDAVTQLDRLFAANPPDP